MTEGVDYFVRLVDLPLSVGGFVALNPDGTYSIYVNARDSVDRQRDTVIHELEHIKKDHLHRAISAMQAEFDVARLA